MVRLGWRRELGPGATLQVSIGSKGEVNGSKWTLQGSLKEALRYKAASLWGVASMKYEVAMPIGDL